MISGVNERTRVFGSDSPGKKALSPVLAAILLFSINACNRPEGHWMKCQGRTQGTHYAVTWNSPDSTDLRPAFEQLLAEFDQSLSTYQPGSIVTRINQDEAGVMVDGYFETCFRAAEEVYRASGGAFDITVAPVVNAWGFGFTERADVDSALIDSLMAYVGMEKVELRAGQLKKEKKGIMLDMNAIAQGYAVDVLAEFLESRGIDDYLVEIGGEVRTLGMNPRGTGWRVGIDQPIEGLQVSGVAMQAIVEISGMSLATSGNYRRFYEEDGMKYSHTIDPFSGYPVQHGLLSATILTDDCMRADAYATACMVLGFEGSVRLIEADPALEAYLIYNDREGKYRTWYSAGFDAYIRKEAN